MKNIKEVDSCLRYRLDYSWRRYYVDHFILTNINKIPEGSLVLDMGGKKRNKRGLFNIDNYCLKVEYANIDPKTKPDYLNDISAVPVPDCTYDAIILSEVLEHIKNPVIVLQEAYRLIKGGGIVIICTPFIFHVHGDPFDYARYTDFWYKEALGDIGFADIAVESQGAFFSVLANMVKLYIYELHKADQLRPLCKRIAYNKLSSWLSNHALRWDSNSFVQNNPVLKGYTTGYGVVCFKPKNLI